MTKIDKGSFADLLDGTLAWDRVKTIMSGAKDPERFDLYVEVLAERLGISDPILLPLGEHLFVVARNGARVVICDCGHEFGPLEKNWKEASRILVRDTEELLEEIYDPYHRCDPAWMQLREFYCPGCFALLEVEAVPPGYPVMYDFQPDIDAFYEQFLGRKPPG